MHMKNKIEIFKLVTHTIDTSSGQIGLKGKYADETKNLNVSDLIPYFARDIFLAQKNESLLKTRINFQVTAGFCGPVIEITLDEIFSEDDFMKTQFHLVQILWGYNYLAYDAYEDRFKKRFSYAFVFKPACESAKAA